MSVGPLVPLPRSPRAAAKADGTGRPDDNSNAVAAQHAAFDQSQAEAAEMQREIDTIESMAMAELKDDDEILKKWIAMI